MPEDLKGFIDKIQREGVQAGEEKGRKIEQEARLKASVLVEDAQKEAQRVLDEASAKAQKAQEITRTELAQASRDCLLALHKEIEAMLDRLVAVRVREALGAEQLGKILEELLRGVKHGAGEGVTVSLSPSDTQKLQETFLSELKAELKKGLVLKPSAEIAGGLTISFDAGRSSFDFTDKALADYIGSCLKPKLKELLSAAADSAPKKK
jgi:V/A-type H+-transporting ATPase subunit E